MNTNDSEEVEMWIRWHRNVAIGLVLSSLVIDPAGAQDAFTRTQQYPGVTVASAPGSPLEVRAVPPPDCAQDLCFPAKLTLTNTSGRVIARAWIVIRLPDVAKGDSQYGIAVFFNNGADPSTRIDPNQTVEVPVDAAKVRALERYLSSTGRSLATATQAIVLVTHVDFEDGGYYTSAGYSQRKG